MTFVTEVELAFARAQIDAGADFVGVGDAAASLIGPDLYREFAWDAEKEFIRRLHAMGVTVRLHICGNINPLLGMLAEVDADLVDLDSMVPIAEARQKMGARECLAGNLNPVEAVRNSSPAAIEKDLDSCFHAAGGTAWAVAAGCEIPRDTPPENLRALGRFAGLTAPPERRLSGGPSAPVVTRRRSPRAPPATRVFIDFEIRQCCSAFWMIFKVRSRNASSPIRTRARMVMVVMANPCSVFSSCPSASERYSE